MSNLKTYRFSENNSGGSWWLARRQYEALEAAGWKKPEEDNTWGDSLSTEDVPYFWRHGWTAEFPSIRAAIESFESATGADFFEEGCNCCGAPYSISGGDGTEHEYMSGDSVERIPVRPW